MGRSRGEDDPVLPEVTSDETDATGGDWREGTEHFEDADAWLVRERPPHWE